MLDTSLQDLELPMLNLVVKSAICEFVNSICQEFIAVINWARFEFKDCFLPLHFVLGLEFDLANHSFGLAMGSFFRAIFDLL